MKVPLWSAARPDICWDCHNLVVSSEHENFWMGRLVQTRTTLDAALVQNDIALALLSRDRLAQCVVVLQKMGVSVPQEIIRES